MLRKVILGTATTAAMALALATVALAHSPAAPNRGAHGIEHDGIYAETPGARISGTLHWLSFAGKGEWTITVTDTRSDGACADLYWRQRNVAGASSGWGYLTHACGYGTSVTRTWANSPFQGGTLYLDFKVVRSEFGNSAADYNQLEGN